MIRFSQGRFHMKGITFEIPEDFSIVTVPENSMEYNLQAFSPDGSYELRWSIDDHGSGAKADLEFWLTPDAGCTAIQPIQEITVSGHKGFWLMGKGANEQFCEYRFDLSDGPQFIFTVRSFGRAIEEVSELYEVNKALDSIVIHPKT